MPTHKYKYKTCCINKGLKFNNINLFISAKNIKKLILLNCTYLYKYLHVCGQISVSVRLYLFCNCNNKLKCNKLKGNCITIIIYDSISN